MTYHQVMMERTNILVLTPDRNVSVNPDGTPGNDFKGAFLPESKRFCALHGVPPEHIERINPTVPTADRLKVMTAAVARIGGTTPIDMVAIFSHGYAHGIQMGLTVERLPPWMKVNAQYLSEDVVWALYCCSTADGEGDQKVGPGGVGGFAQRLRDELCAAGKQHCLVFGHSTAGHTTSNPYVRVFRGMIEGEPAPVDQPGAFLIDPSDPRWGKWRAMLKDRDSQPLRLQYPLMTPDELDAALAAGS